MPGNVENGDSIWTTVESKTQMIYSRPCRKSSSSSSAAANRSDPVRVGGLEVPAPPGQSLAAQQRPHCSTAACVEQAVSRGSFSVYEGGDLNEFFGCDVFAPQRVTEVCLVSDHYILVKVPENSRPQHPQRSSNANEEHVEPTQGRNEFPRRLRYGNSWSRRISPTPETVPSGSRVGATSWSTSDCVQEVFNTRTTIQGNLRVFQTTAAPEVRKQERCSASREFPNAATSPSRSSLTRPPLQTTLTSHANLEPHEPPFENDHGDGTWNIPGQRSSPRPQRSFRSTLRGTSREFQNAATSPLRPSPPRTPLKTSLSCRVNLEARGRLETEHGDGIWNNARKHSLPRPRRPFGLSLRTFLQSFRNRPTVARTSPKKNKKINAVVYKTYFMSWIKAGKQPRCSHCRDVHTPLRRTQSAVF